METRRLTSRKVWSLSLTELVKSEKWIGTVLFATDNDEFPLIGDPFCHHIHPRPYISSRIPPFSFLDEKAPMESRQGRFLRRGCY